MLEFEFPDTGEGVTEGQFLEWTVEEGESIEEDQVVAEVETDKAVVDIPAPTNGVVKELKASPGDNIKVGDVIMIIDDGSSAEPAESSESREDNPEETEEHREERVEEKEQEQEDAEPAQSSSEDVLALPKVRKLAEQKGVDLSSIKTGERITEDEVLAASGTENTEEPEKEVEKEISSAEDDAETSEKTETVSTEGANASPSVRRLARQKGVDISAIDGSGRGDTVTRNDVLNASEGSNTKIKSGSGAEDRVSLTPVQKRISERMTESKYTAPHVTHVDTADVTDLVNMREKLKQKVDTHLTYMPFIIKAALEALEEYPELNAEIDEENNELVLKHHYDFNIAVDTEDGLMVPLIEDVDQKSVVELSEEVSEKAGAAKHGDLSAGDMKNGTFSITNLGVIGGEEFTPIINYPQSSILGVGRIQETAEVVDGEVVPRMTMKISLSYDHRIVDGATAARFTNELIENLENPEKMLLEL